MTAPDNIATAYEAFLDALIRGPWRTHPERANSELEARRRDLRDRANHVDRSRWPRGVATLLWTPAPHEIPTVPSPVPVAADPRPFPDCRACE